MIAEEFDINWFKLETSTTSVPATGIKINIDGTKNYQSQSTFRFTDKTASKESRLNNLILSNGEKNEEEPEKATYKEYDLNPTFDKDHLDYEVTLMEYLNTIDLKATLEDAKATMKIKVPTKDEDGTTIIYEEKELSNDLSLPITLNKLGEPDTVVTITVTAEDGKTTNEYVVTIKRPYGTITGKVQLGDGLREGMEASYGVTTKYIANITLYKPDEFNWDGILLMENTLNELDNIKEETQVTSDEEGNYTIYVIPGTYDCLIEKKGFLAQAIKKITIKASDTIDLDTRILIEGDCNRSGIIDLDDMIDIVNYSGTSAGDGIYDEQYDFGQKGFIGLDDLVSVTTNMYNTIKIEEFTN